MKWGLDAAYAPAPHSMLSLRQGGWQWIAGYVGGTALHVWSLDDWQRASAVGFELLPIWVAPVDTDLGRQVGVDQGNACLIALGELGLSGVVVLDVEDGLVLPEYAGGFVDAVHAGDCRVALYGSASTLLDTPDDFDAWWLAKWVGSEMAISNAPPDWSLWQFSSGTNFDYSVAVDEFTFALLQSPEAPSAPPSAEA